MRRPEPEPPLRLSCEYHWGHPGVADGGTHRHDLHEFLLVIQGSYRVRIANRSWTGGAGDGFYYPPGCAHTPRRDRTRASRFHLLRWSGGARILPERPLRHHDRDHRLLLTLDWLAKETGPIADPPTALATSLWQVVVQTLTADVVRTTPSSRQGPVQRARLLIRNLSANPLGLEELAELVGLSASQLVRRFRAETGLTPMQALRLERVEHAARLLASTDLRLAEIAAQVGLADAAHLSHLFKRERGESPALFRARVRGER